MNLWVKRTGQFLIAALFLISCEDETFLLGFKNQNKKFGVRYQEFTLPSSVVLIDSLVTDNHDNSLSRFLIGEYVDTRFGTVRAEAFTQIYPSGTTKLDASSVYDSITLQLRLDFYSYGSDSEHEDERFRIHEITEDSITFSKRYYYNSTLGYDVTPLAEVSFDVNYDTLQKNLGLSSSSQDTLLVTTRLADEFGFRLFNLALNDPSSEYSDNRKFRSKIKGLAFVPSQSNLILGYSPASFSKLTIHYHTATDDSLECRFFMNSVYTSTVKSSSFNNISTDRTGDLAAITESYSGNPDPANITGSRYLQNGSPVITKIDIGEYYNFIRGQVDGKDTLQNILINSAEISVDAVETPPDGLPPPSTLVLRIMNSDDLFLNSVLDADSASMAGYYVASDGKYYLAGNDGLNNPTQPVTLVYDSQKKSYRGFVTLFMQNLFDRKSEDTEILYLGLIPVSPTPGKTVSRTVFNANSIKLKIHYTAPVSSNLQ